jgi:hypothetical protein
MAMEDGRPRYVTSVSQTDVNDGLARPPPRRRHRDRRAGEQLGLCTACPCRIRHACTAASSGCWTPAPATSGTST